MDKTQLTTLLQFIKTVPDNNFLAAACLAALASKSDTEKTALLLNELYSSSEKKQNPFPNQNNPLPHSYTFQKRK